MFRPTLFLLVFFTLLGCDWLGGSKEPVNHADHKKEAKTEVYYTCSMHPHIREDKPGKCPICHMNLTKVVLEHDQKEKTTSMAKEMYQCKDFPDVTSEKPETCPLDGTPMVKMQHGSKPGHIIAGQIIGKVKLRNAQLKHFRAEVFPVTTMTMSKKLRVLGQVKSAEEKASNIAARFPARVEKVFVESVGSQIKKGDPVVQVYSPELLTTGEELILSSQQSSEGNEFSELYKKAREKLLLWGIKSSQINRWVKNGKVPRNVTLFASSSGVVRKRIAVPGKYFTEGQNYFELSDLSQVWVEMDVYEQDSNLIQPGQKVSLSFVALPDEKKIGEIDFISPTIDEKNRTLKVRTTIANSEGTLKPGMVAQATINVQLEGTPLVVPNTAVIDTGVRKIVWLQQDDQHYVARLVETGFLSDGYVEVAKGLKEGDPVVIEGGFLLDAQAQFFGGYEDFAGKASGKYNH